MLKNGHRTRYHLRAFEFLAARRRSRAVLTCTLLTAFLASMPTGGLQAGDILRGGASAGNAKRNSEARANAGAASAQAAKVRAQDRLARTTKAINDMRALQASARAAAGANSIPNGLTDGGLKVLTGANAKWEGANAPAASGNNVNITQTASPALLHIGTRQDNASATLGFVGWSRENRPRLDYDIANFTRSYRIVSKCSIKQETHILCFLVQNASFSQNIIDRKGRGDEGAGVDLGAGAEDDAVLVDDVDLALGVDFATDLGGFGGGVEDFVEGDPFAGVGSAAA